VSLPSVTKCKRGKVSDRGWSTGTVWGGQILVLDGFFESYQRFKLAKGVVLKTNGLESRMVASQEVGP
jgi:hypothetical protein